MISRLLILFLIAFSPTAKAMVIRTYSATAHKRFDPFPTSALINPNHIFASTDLTGIGYRFGTYPTRQCALISRQHIVFANHYRDQVGSGTQIRFLNAANVATTRNTGTRSIIQDTGQNSDLIIVPLSAPIDASSGISPLPYLNLASLEAYAGTPLGVMGKFASGDITTGQVPLAGSGTLFEVDADSLEVNFGGSIGVLRSRYMRFNYGVTGGPNDCYPTVGDSGSPTVAIVSGQAALVGVHSFVDKPVEEVEAYECYDVFIPHYVNELNTVMAPLGYRMRPFTFSATTLATDVNAVQVTPRKMLPLDWQVAVSNTGAHVTGNLEVEFQFDAETAPDSVTSPGGWVSYVAGTKHTFRRATMDPSATATFTAHWDEAPIADELNAVLTRRSDTTADDVVPMSLDLAPSFAEWAAGLAQTGEQDDPDEDGIPNLIEYALGGDPENGHRVFADGSPLGPVLQADSGIITVRFSERADKETRGLSYVLEFSNTLSGWNDPPPDGIMSSSVPFDPPVDGFVQRTVTWPLSSNRNFVRLRISLDE